MPLRKLCITGRDLKQEDWLSMKELTGYGKAAREIVPDLKALIVQFNTECGNDQFPEDCNKLRVESVRKAIKAIEAAKNQPELRSIGK